MTRKLTNTRHYLLNQAMHKEITFSSNHQAQQLAQLPQEIRDIVSSLIVPHGETVDGLVEIRNNLDDLDNTSYPQLKLALQYLIQKINQLSQDANIEALTNLDRNFQKRLADVNTLLNDF